MKRFSIALAVLAIGTCAVVMGVPPQHDRGPTDPREHMLHSHSHAKVGQLDEATSGSNIRVSQLIGMGIQNQKGKSIGSVNDIVINAKSGKVRYAAVSYGGFMGLGDKLFAVPWQAFKYQKGEKEAEHKLVLNATEQQLKSATGFDQDNWPNFADHSFTSQLDRHYGVEYQADRRSGGVNVKVGPGGVDVDVDVNRRSPDK